MSRALRLVWMLITLLLVVPAMQASACAPAAIGHGAHAGTAHHGQHEQQVPGPSHHDCIGCVAPIDIGAYRPVDRLRYALLRSARARDAAAPRSRNAPPEPPPPRQSV